MLDNKILFSGDTLFLNSVGRPDLKAELAESQARARALCESLHQLMALGTETLILPGHAGRPVPFDQVPIATPLKAVVDNVAAWYYDEERFVTWILNRIPPVPANYEHIVQLNEAGILPATDPTRLEAGANHCAV